MFWDRGWGLAAHSLSGRLLLLTLIYALASEVLIFVPAIGLYHRELLDDHILAAELAILPFASPGGQILPESLQKELLRHANADAVLLKRADQRQLFLPRAMPARVDRTIDLTADTVVADMVNGLDCLLFGGARTLHVIAPTRIENAQTIGIVLGEAPIRSALLRYAGRVVAAALFISGLTAALVFASLYIFVVRPTRRITKAMTAFRENPEDAGRILVPSSRADEIGLAERELSAMQRDLYGFLQQKTRLAALGAAVASIQHDLRNIFAAAQLASDRLATIEDPVVKRLAPGLVKSIDHAIALATSTLKFVRRDEQAPRRSKFMLQGLVEEAALSVLGGSESIVFDNRIGLDLCAHADREQVFRIVLNLIRNALQALPDAGGTITASAARNDGRIEIDITDSGCGVSDAVRTTLFQPFASARAGGSGLGLAIARELARGHGGDLSLVETSPQGTVFRIALPDRD